MRAFLIGVAAAIVIGIVAAVALTVLETSTADTFQADPNVRL